MNLLQFVDDCITEDCSIAGQRRTFNYVGVLGPRSRTTRMLSESAIKIHPKLHAPIGLDIGADGPDQVAISIIAEILAHKNHRSALPLRQRIGPIHDPVKIKTTEAQRHREENSVQKLTTNRHE